MKAIRICYLTTSYPRFDGDEASIFVERLAEALSQKGVHLTVVVPKDRTEPVIEHRLGIEIKRFGYRLFAKEGLAFGAGIIPNLKRNPFLIFQAPLLFLGMLLKSFFVAQKSDFIIANWIFSAAVAFALSILTGKQYIYIVRGAEINLFKSKVLRFLFAPVINSASSVVCVSAGFVETISKYYPNQNKCKFIPNGITVYSVTNDEVNSLASRKGIDTSKKHLLFVGTLIPRKNIDYLFELLTSKELAEYHLIVCGRLSDQLYVKHLRDKILALNLDSRVKLEGEVSPKEVSAYLEISSAYITASKQEGTPNAVLEAISYGKPVFASDIEAHRELLGDFTKECLFPLDNKEKAALAIKTLILDSANLHQIAKNCQEKLKGRNWEAAAEAYLSLCL
ncbi:MAG: glycosyltransferase family 4 protein [bacterium]|nr:glycosyltransferase family 4 protein [bacterium]